jgi:hypothetical protein
LCRKLSYSSSILDNWLCYSCFCVYRPVYYSESHCNHGNRYFEEKFICIWELLIECSADDITNQTVWLHIHSMLHFVLTQEIAVVSTKYSVFNIALPRIGHTSRYLLACFSNVHNECIVIKLCESVLNGNCIY